MIKGLHHNAYRCRDSEETRAFYEDFLGLPLAGTLVINETKSGRATKVLHTFYRMDDGSFLAFFEAPDMAFEFKPQHDFDLHIALEVTAAARRLIADEGFDPAYGARPLRRLISREVETQVGRALLRGDAAEGGVMTVDVADGKITVTAAGNPAEGRAVA